MISGASRLFRIGRRILHKSGDVLFLAVDRLHLDIIPVFNIGNVVYPDDDTKSDYVVIIILYLGKMPLSKGAAEMGAIFFFLAK